MTDLREKIEGILYDYGLEYGGPICMVTKATDAIMALVQPVVTDELFDQMILDCEQLYGALMAEKKWTEAEELERRIDWLRSRKGGAS